MSQNQPSQTMPGAVKLERPPVYDGTMDYEIIEAWIFSVDNYYALVGLTDEIQQSRFASTLLTKNAALWLRTSGMDLRTTKWSTMRQELRSYFRPADFKRRARDELANLRQIGKVTSYIDVFKRTCAKIQTISDEEMLDCFVRGLAAPIQREILKQDPPTFAVACQMAERLARLDAVIDARFSDHANVKQKQNQQHNNNNPYHQGGFLPTDVQMSLLDYLQGGNRRSRAAASNQQFDRQARGRARNRSFGNNRGNYNNTNRNQNFTQTQACYICGKPGHLARDCYHNPANRQNRYGSNFRNGRQNNRGHFNQTRGRLNNAAEPQQTQEQNCDFFTSAPKN